MNPDILENFIRAFSTNSSGCRRTCNCGREFYNNDPIAWDWEEGELEMLINSDATPLEYSVKTFQFEECEYVPECTCWKPLAAAAIGLFEKHARQIAAFLTLEKKRKQAEADNAPEVK